jgi:type I restriction enzyme, S subunit
VTRQYSPPEPTGWKTSKVGDVFRVVGGGTPSTHRTDFWQGPIPWITSADIDEGRVSSKKTISLEAIASSATNLIPAGSVVVVTRVGLGKVGIAETDLCFSQDCQGLLFNSVYLEPRFVLHQMSRAVMGFAAIGRGTTISGVTKQQLLDTPFVLAPRHEQRRIVEAIESYFTRFAAAVATLERVKANLKRYRASVLKAAVEGRLVPAEAEVARKEGRDYESGSVLLERILKERRRRWEATERAKLEAAGKAPRNDSWTVKYDAPVALDTSTLPELPEGWCWASAEQISEFVTKGTTPSAEHLGQGKGDVPYVKVYNLTFDGTLNFDLNPTFVTKRAHSKDLARSVVRPGDVLMNIVGPPLGKVSIVPPLYPEWNINQAIARYRPVSGLSSRYLAVALRAETILSWAKRRSKATAGQFNLTLEISRQLPIPLPPEAEQLRIVSEVERHETILAVLEQATENGVRRTTRLRQAILRWAFEGKLLSQDPTDEPASALLERIKAERQKVQVECDGNPRRGRTRKTA